MIEQLAKKYSEDNYSKAPFQNIGDAEYIQAVSYNSFIAGYESKQSSSPSLEGLISHWAGRLSHVSTLLQRDDFIGIDRTVALTLKKTITDFLSDLRQLPSIKEGWIDVKETKKKVIPQDDTTLYDKIIESITPEEKEKWNADLQKFHDALFPPAKQL